MIPVLTLLCLGVPVPTSTAIDPVAVWVEANKAYQGGDYATAVTHYERLVDAGFASGYLYYNLGNGYLRTGRLGRAVAAYLQSERQLPRDPDVAANLAFARQSTQDALPVAPAMAVLRTLFFWHFVFSPRELLLAALVTNSLFWVLLGVRLFRREWDALRWAISGTLVVLVMVGGSWIWHTLAPERVVVVEGAEVAVHSGTDRSSVVQFNLHAGTEASLVEERGEWLRIALQDEKQGWVHRDDVIALRL